jgi:ribosomal protein S17E
MELTLQPAGSTVFGFVSGPTRGYATKPLKEVFMQEFETLKRLVQEAEDDVNKAIGGNKAAGTRVRKKMQDIKSAAQDVRKKILEGREAEPA